MNWPWGKELLERWKRKHALPIVLYGALLLLAVLLYGIGDGWFQGASRDGPASSGAESLETRLEGILTEMRGAGRVRVLLTLKTGPAARYQTDVSRSASAEGERSSQSTEEKTVMLERGGAYNEPAVVSMAYPVFQGALVLAEGADDAALRLRLTAAVAALLGLGADQITVVKMK